ncbi:hypothetical protein [Staphylococcus pettenkoferi]|uniref:hypothetical protein n=1 Tax=Staphylococcus pettenkoferi TaxID=170573 RepID=UPI002555CFA8|nr:hypothetical protein [Staphylococcus pettenkoferi]MDK7284479.1 hypothetical protein [Staphylococcus pettenkoferi]
MKQIKSELYENHINYMENETLGDIVYTINKNEISVISYEWNTIFVNLKRKPYIELNQILELMKEVRKLSREQKVKIKGINRLKERVHNLHEEYSKEYRKYDEAFDILAVLWLNHVDKLKIGTRNDVIYQEVILKHQFDLEKYSYQSSILSRVDNIYSRLYNTSKQLKRENTLTMVQL